MFRSKVVYAMPSAYWRVFFTCTKSCIWAKLFAFIDKTVILDDFTRQFVRQS